MEQRLAKNIKCANLYERYPGVEMKVMETHLLQTVAERESGLCNGAPAEVDLIRFSQPIMNATNHIIGSYMPPFLTDWIGTRNNTFPF